MKRKYEKLKKSETVLTRKSFWNCAAESGNRVDTGEQWPNKSDVTSEDSCKS